jgi:hypothetical protein
MAANSARNRLEEFNWLQPNTEGIWSGTATSLARVSAVIDFWEEWRTGLVTREHSLVAAGDCGPVLQEQLGLTLRAKSLATAISSNTRLQELVPALWQGLQTDLEEGERIVSFALRIAGPIEGFATSEEERIQTRAAVRRLCGLTGGGIEYGTLLAEAATAITSVAPALRNLLEAGEFSPNAMESASVRRA